MTTEPRLKDETAAERALRFAQAKFDELPSDRKQGRRRPGSIKKNGMYSPARKKRGWWRKVSAPKGWDE